MLFLNLWLLLGLLAISVPVVLHLLNRRSVIPMEWGAMQFLLDSMASRRRRILLEEMLLLAARCLLLSFIVLAMARPFIPPGSSVPWWIVMPAMLLAITAFGVSFALWRYPTYRRYLLGAAFLLVLLSGLSIGLAKWLDLKRFGGAGQRDIAIIIDGSSSMTRVIDGKSNFERAADEARNIIESTGGGAAWSIIVAGGHPQILTPAPVLDRDRLTMILDELEPVHGKMDVLDAMTAAGVSLSEGFNPNKQIVIITDGQKVGWDKENTWRWQFVKDTFEGLPAPPLVLVRQIEMPLESRNASVAGITFSRDIIGTDREVTINVRIENTGTEAITPSGVELTVGGRNLKDETIGQIIPGSSETVRFLHHFEKPGAHVVAARMLVDDEIPTDNRLETATAVIGKLRALIVNGKPSARFLDRTGALIGLALAPGAAVQTVEGERMDYLIDPVMAEYDRLAGRDFSPYDVIILADVPSLHADVAERIAAFVNSGGGLLIAPGEAANSKFYNEWKHGEDQPVLPSILKKRVLLKDGLQPSLTTFSHHALRLIADKSRSDISSLQVSAYWKLDDANTDRSVSIGGRLSNSDPLLAERKLGRGIVLLMSHSLDAHGSNVASRHAFLPLVHEVVFYLSDPSSATLNVPPSPAFSLRLTGGAVSSPLRGLKGDYFRDQNFRRFFASRADPVIQFHWANGAPMKGMPADNFSVRWSGSIFPRYTETYTFEVKTDYIANVWVGRKQVVNRNKADKIQLKAGQRYQFRVEYVENNAAALLDLYWSSKSQVREIIPASRLSVAGADFSLAPKTDATVKGPDGSSHKAVLVEGLDGLVARISGNLPPGLYHLTIPQGDQRKKLSNLVGEDGTVPFTVTPDVDESRVDRLTEADLEALGNIAGIVPVADTEKLQAALAGQSTGKELWRYLATGAFLLLLGEVALTRWIAHQRKTGQKVEVEFDDRMKPSEQFQEQLERIVKSN